MAAVWALADLHLSFGVPGKEMDVFGPQWAEHAARTEKHWKESIDPDDLILIPGDISWAMTPDEAKSDLEWIHALPGTKVMIKGNHDFWWSSLSKVEKVLPPSIHLIQNNAFLWNDVAVAGARLWDTHEYKFNRYIDYIDNPRARKLTEAPVSEETERIFARELNRLETSLKCLSPKANVRMAMTHYPPISADLQPSRVSALLEKYRIGVCAFGHLHNVKHDIPLFGEKDGVKYVFAAADYLRFKPVLLLKR